MPRIIAIAILASIAATSALLVSVSVGQDEAAESFVIVGDVVDEQGKAVAEAEVFLLANPPRSPVVSDAQGRFMLKVPVNQSGARVLVFVAKSGAGSLQGIAWYQGKAIPERVRLTLRRARELTVEVVDAAGRPVSEAAVWAVAMSRIAVQEKTNAAGRFMIDMYPNQIVAMQSSSGRFVSNVETLVVREKASEQDVNLILKPGVRVFGKLTAGKDRLPLSHRLQDFYQRVPDLDEALRQLPNPTGVRRTIALSMNHESVTNMQGEFEVFVPTGDYWVYKLTPDEEPLCFTIKDATPTEFNMHFAKPDRLGISGRVVLQAKPQQGVAACSLHGWSFDSLGGHFTTISDGEGRFRGERERGEMLVHAATADGALAGIAKLGPEDTSMVVPIGPTGTARGRLVGPKARDRHILWGVKIVYNERGSHRHACGGYVMTDADGNFTISGLAPGWKYELVIVDEEENGSRSFSVLKSITLSDASHVEEIGDLRP